MGSPRGILVETLVGERHWPSVAADFRGVNPAELALFQDEIAQALISLE